MIKRIKKRNDFLAVAKGKRWVTQNFTLQARQRVKDVESSGAIEQTDLNAMGLELPRLGYTVTKKAGNSVQRNRIRRRLKSAIYFLMPEFTGHNLDQITHLPHVFDLAHANYDYVLIGRQTLLHIDFTILINELRSAFEGVHRTRSSGRA